MSQVKSQKGLHLPGGYIITPLGIATLLVIVLAIAAIFLVPMFTGGKPAADNAAQSGSASAAPSVAPSGADTVITPVEPTAEPTLTPTPVPTPTPEPTPGVATVRFMPGITVDENVILSAREADGSYDFTDMLVSISGITAGADYTVANVEGSMGGIGDGYSGKTDYNTPEYIISNLADIGVDMLTIANDHALDAGFTGLMDTLANCGYADMAYTGAAANAEEKAVPKIVMVNGIKVCFLNYTTTLNSKESATDGDALTYGVNLVARCSAPSDIKAAREAGADVVIVVMSWSDDGSADVTSTQNQVAKVLGESGADVIIGYGPRIIQPVAKAQFTVDGEKKDVWCAWSLGTLLTDSTVKGSNCGMMVDITITPQPDGTFAIEAPVCIPTYVWRTKTEEGFDYKVLACGEWIEEKPEGMSNEDYLYMTEYWKWVPGRVGDSAKVEAN